MLLGQEHIAIQRAKESAAKTKAVTKGLAVYPSSVASDAGPFPVGVFLGWLFVQCFVDLSGVNRSNDQNMHDLREDQRQGMLERHGVGQRVGTCR